MSTSLCSRAAPPARNSMLLGMSRSGAWVGLQVLQLAAPREGAICILSTFPGLAIVRTHSLSRVQGVHVVHVADVKREWRSKEL